MKFFNSVLLATIIALSLSACDKVDVGNVGIKVNLTGDSRGVEKSPVVSGYVFYNPFTSDVIEFPTTVYNVTYENEEAIHFASKEGLPVGANVSFSFHIDASKAPRFYARFKQEDLDIFAHSYLQRTVRDALNEQASSMTIRSIYGEGKTSLLMNTKRHLEQTLSKDGVLVDQLTFNSALVLPQNVQQAINNATTQNELATAAQNKVEQIKAEANQKIEAAKGAAAAIREQSIAEADAILVKAKAQAQANELLQKSIGQQLIELERVKRWDGRLPVIGSNGNGMIIDMRGAQALSTN